jgi:hypothetical protein
MAVADWPGSAVGVITAPVVGLAAYVDGKPVPTEITTDRLRQSVIDRTHGNGNFTLGERFRDRGFRGGEIDSLSVFNSALRWKSRGSNSPEKPISPPFLQSSARLGKNFRPRDRSSSISRARCRPSP